jgi:L-lactate utilization protein LutB
MPLFVLAASDAKAVRALCEEARAGCDVDAHLTSLFVHCLGMRGARPMRARDGKGSGWCVLVTSAGNAMVHMDGVRLLIEWCGVERTVKRVRREGM